MSFREFLRSQCSKYFETLDYDALFFVETGKIYTYPEGIETMLGYGKDMDLEYKDYLKQRLNNV